MVNSNQVTTLFRKCEGFLNVKQSLVRLVQINEHFNDFYIYETFK